MEQSDLVTERDRLRRVQFFHFCFSVLDIMHMYSGCFQEVEERDAKISKLIERCLCCVNLVRFSVVMCICIVG